MKFRQQQQQQEVNRRQNLAAAQYLFLRLFLIWYCFLLIKFSTVTEFIAEGAKLIFLVDKSKPSMIN